MWNNNNASGGAEQRGRVEKDRTYEVLHYPSAHKPIADQGSNGNRGADGNKNRYSDLPRYRVVEQVCILPPLSVQFVRPVKINSFWQFISIYGIKVELLLDFAL